MSSSQLTETDPILQMYEAQAIIVEKEQEIRRLTQELNAYQTKQRLEALEMNVNKIAVSNADNIRLADQLMAFQLSASQRLEPLELDQNKIRQELAQKEVAKLKQDIVKELNDQMALQWDSNKETLKSIFNQKAISLEQELAETKNNNSDLIDRLVFLETNVKQLAEDAEKARAQTVTKCASNAAEKIELKEPEMVLQLSVSQAFETLKSTGLYKLNNNDSETTKRPLRLSSLLATSEQDSVRHFVGKNAALLACGVCQLLEEKNGTWQLFGVGVICLIRDYDKKIFSLSLVDPTSDGSPAYSMWDATLGRNFITMKNHPHLISFELLTGFFGLNFSEDREAEDFHRFVITLRNEYLSKQSIRKPKRKAPEFPSAQNEPIDHIHEETTSSGIAIPVLVVKEKKKKRGIFGNIKNSIFYEKEENKKKEKSKTKPIISNPTNFQQLQYGLEGMSEEQKAMFATIMESGKFQLVQGEEEELHGLIKKAVIDNYDDLKVELEHRKREVDQKKEELPMNRQENEHTAFQRTTSNDLSEIRSSLKIVKITRGNTPRDIKKQSSVKKQENFNPFRADWDEEHQLPPTSLAPPPLVEDLPPAISARTHFRRNNFIHQNTPPYSRFGPPVETPPLAAPRLKSSLWRVPPQHPPSPSSVKLAPISTSPPPPPCVSSRHHQRQHLIDA